MNCIFSTLGGWHGSRSELACPPVPAPAQASLCTVAVLWATAAASAVLASMVQSGTDALAASLKAWMPFATSSRRGMAWAGAGLLDAFCPDLASGLAGGGRSCKVVQQGSSLQAQRP